MQENILGRELRTTWLFKLPQIVFTNYLRLDHNLTYLNNEDKSERKFISNFSQIPFEHGLRRSMLGL